LAIAISGAPHRSERWKRGPFYPARSEGQARALELKRQGKPADEAGQTLLAEFRAKFRDWSGLNAIPNIVKHVYAENQLQAATN